MVQDEMSSRVWVCMSTSSSTKVVIVDATQPTELLDSFYACNTHVLCIASVPGRLRGHTPSSVWFTTSLSRLETWFCALLPGALDSDYPAGEEVPQDPEASQGDVASLAGSVASTGSDGATAAEGATAVPQTASSGVSEQPAEYSATSGPGSSLQYTAQNRNTQRWVNAVNVTALV